MKKLLEKLATQLDILTTGKTRFFGTLEMLAKPATTISSKNK